MKYLGDYAEDYATLNFKFHSRTLAQVPATLSGTPAISVYKANGTTQSTAGITLSVDFDSVTGLNNVLIDLSADAFYAVANDYQVVITTGTVNSVSVVGTVLAHFSIENRFNEVDVTKLGGATQSATDLKDLVDSGYDPSTHKIEGVKLSDALTTNNDKTGYTASTVSDKTGYSLSAGGVTAVQSGLSTLTAQQVWEYATRTLSTFGSLVADTATAVWGAVARTITGGTITTVSDKTGYSISGTKQTLDALNDFDHSTDIVAHVTLTDTCTTNTDMRGTNSALLASGYTAPDNASITSIKGKTDQLTFTTPNSVDATATVSTAGLATEANQTTIINHLTDVKGATFSGSTDSLEAIRNRGDVAWITGGTGGGSNAVTINVKDDNAANVVDCYVEIWDSAGTSLISRTNTNSSGNVTFGLDTNTYIVKMHKTGYYFENQTMEVGHDETFPYTGTILTPDAPTNPTLCRIYGYYFDPAGSTYSAVKSLIKLTAIYEASDNNYYTSELVGTYNTTTGLLYFDVIQGASVTLEIPILNVKKSFVVPATTLYKISDIA